MTAAEIRNSFSDELHTELHDHILAFWLKNAPDTENGGFIGRLTGTHEACPKAHKSVILNARILWTFSAAGRVTGNQDYLDMAGRAYNYLEQHFHDKKYGGFYWSVNYEGIPNETKKHVYAQVFVVYAYSEYFRLTGNLSALERAKEVFRLIENHAGSHDKRGYIEAFDEKWNPLDDVRLSPVDQNEARSMNTHIHVMEAYANLYRVWQHPVLYEKLSDLVILVLDLIYDPENQHFSSFFDADWNLKSGFYSYGHDIETAWLLVDSAKLLNDETLIRRTGAVLIETAGMLLNEGIDPDTGGVYNQGFAGSPVDPEYQWWVQAEAVTGLYYAAELTGDERFLKAAYGVWDFVRNYVKDRERGEWFFRLDKDGKPVPEEDKIGPWKCPYHNTRFCLELLEMNGIPAAGTGFSGDEKTS